MQCFLQKAFSRNGITLGAQEKVDRSAGGIYGSV
jgi:hypothetical protein